MSDTPYGFPVVEKIVLPVTLKLRHQGGFLYGEPCGEPARGGPCMRTLGHGGGHRHDGRERVVEEEK